MDIRLIASDIDGTILPRGGIISRATRRALALCRERSIPFIIASGRWLGTAREVAQAAGATGVPIIIANGGAVVAPDGTPMREWFMRPQDVQTVYRILRGYDVMINSFVRNGLYRLNTQALDDPSLLKSYIGEGDLRVVSDDLAAFEGNALDRVYKMEAIVENPELLARVQADLVAAGLSVTSSYWRNLEIMSPGMGKGTAVKWLAGELGIPMAQCMAFGDNTNDLDMLRVVGWPVAVENAVDELKAVAWKVAPDCAEDGVAQVILRDVMGEEWP